MERYYARPRRKTPTGWQAGSTGADIALLVPNPTLAAPIGERLRERLGTEASARLLPGHTNVWLAGGRFPRDTDPAALLAHVDAALAAAEAKKTRRRSRRPISPAVISHRNEQWSLAIHQALERNWVQLAAYPVRGFNGALMLGNARCASASTQTDRGFRQGDSSRQPNGCR